MKKFLTSLAVGMACLAASVSQAQISVGPTGAGPLTFDTTPAAAEFSTFVLNGTGTTFGDALTLDAAVANLTVAGINAISRQLPTSTTVPPSAFSGGFRHNNGTGLYLQSRPTTDGTNAASAMLGTFVNNSGASRTTINLSYDFNSFNPATGQLPGFNVYYSLTGEANSWQPIASLTGSETIGSSLATVSLGTWPVGASLYVLWVDDNADGITDPSYTIDNLRVAFGIDPPVITQQPVGGSVTEGRSFTFTVVATGPGLTYAWEKVGFGVVGTSSSLTITNAQASDAGQYFVRITNPGASVSSSTVTLTVADDTTPPTLLSARIGADSASITLTVDETLCDDVGGACFSGTVTTFATDAFAWAIVNASNPFDTPAIITILLQNGTNLVFTTSALDGSQVYRVIMVGASGNIGDLFGNGVPPDTFVETQPTIRFQQNLGGYTGTQDTYIQSNVADQNEGGNTVLETDSSNPAGGISQGLIRFDNIVGTNPGQIPPSAAIILAELTFTQTDPGSPAGFHRMLVDWNQASATWNVLNGGVTNDNVEAAIAADATSPNAAGNGLITLNVTSSVQAWADGLPNYGWLINPTGTDGWRLNTSESSAAPILTVVYRVDPCVTAPVITTQPPATLSPIEGSTFSITVGVDACSPTYQWTKNNVDIPGANGSTLTIANAVPGAAGNNGSYRLRITNPNGTVTSSATVVTVGPDPTRPVLTRAIGSADGTTVTLTFSKAMSAASAQNVANYTFTPAVTVNSAVLSANALTVTVTTATRTLSAPYRLRISGLTDTRTSANVIDPNPTFVDINGTSILVSAWDATWSYATNSQSGNWTTGPLGPEWLTGQAFFGFEPTAAITNGLPVQPNPIKTPLQANDTNVLGFGNSEIFVSSYFRRQITLPALAANTTYALCFYVDDGAIFYLDGAEIGRYQMPAGPVTFTTRSTGGNGEAVFQCILFNATPGVHTLAAEVHQAGVSTSDVLFGVEVRVISLPSKLAISRVTGGDRVTWTADATWELVGSQNVAGPYAPVAGTSFGLFNIPAASQTNHFFYHLRYRDGQ